MKSEPLGIASLYAELKANFQFAKVVLWNLLLNKKNYLCGSYGRVTKGDVYAVRLILSGQGCPAVKNDVCRAIRQTVRTAFLVRYGKRGRTPNGAIFILGTLLATELFAVHFTKYLKEC